MKNYQTTKLLPWVTLCGGILGLALRLILNATENDKGFVTRWHWSTIALVALTALFLAGIYVLTRPMRQANKFEFNFPASLFGGIGAALAAVGFGFTSITELLAARDLLTTVSAALGIVAALALLVVAYTRWQGKRPSMILHSLICAYLMVRLICMYRQWSSDPQLTDYAFELLALVCAMLAAYHRATFDANLGRRASFAFFSLAAVYFCFLGLGGENQPLLYGAVGLWLFADRCDLTPLPREFWEDAQ